MTVAFEIKRGFGCKMHDEKTITYKVEETKTGQRSYFSFTGLETRLVFK
jgi:hypothetical protein